MADPLILIDCDADCSSSVGAFRLVECVRRKCWDLIIGNSAMTGVDVGRVGSLLDECRRRLLSIRGFLPRRVIEEYDRMSGSARLLCELAALLLDRDKRREVPRGLITLVERLRRLNAVFASNPVQTLERMLIGGGGRIVKILDDIVEVSDALDELREELPSDYLRYYTVLKEAIEKYFFGEVIGEAFNGLIARHRYIAAIVLHRMISEAAMRQVEAIDLSSELEKMRDEIINSMRDYINSIIVGAQSEKTKALQHIQQLGERISRLEDRVAAIVESLKEVREALQDDNDRIAKSVKTVEEVVKEQYELLKQLAESAVNIAQAGEANVEDANQRFRLLDEAWSVVLEMVDALYRASRDKRLVVKGGRYAVHSTNMNDYGVMRVYEVLLEEEKRLPLSSRKAIRVVYIVAPKLDNPGFITMCNKLLSKHRATSEMLIIMAPGPIPKSVAEAVHARPDVAVIEWGDKTRIIAKRDRDTTEMLLAFLPNVKLLRALALQTACTIASRGENCPADHYEVDIEDLRGYLGQAWWTKNEQQMVEEVVQNLIKEYGYPKLCVATRLCQP